MTESATAVSDALALALVEEATKKSGFAWLRSAADVDARPRAAWLLWHEGSAYVVHGGSEQAVPALSGGGKVEVTVRSKDNGSRVVAWIGAPTHIAAGSEEWDTVLPLLMAKRLNLIDGEAAAARWASECTVVKLTPTGEIPQRPGTIPADSGAEVPAQTPATTEVPMPFTVGGAFRKTPKGRRQGLFGRPRPS